MNIWKQLAAQIEEFGLAIKERFVEVEERTRKLEVVVSGAHESRLDSHSESLRAHEGHLETLGKRADDLQLMQAGINESQGDIEGRMRELLHADTALAAKVDRINEALFAAEKNVETLGKRLDVLEGPTNPPTSCHRRLDDLEGQIREQRKLLEDHCAIPDGRLTSHWEMLERLQKRVVELERVSVRRVDVAAQGAFIGGDVNLQRGAAIRPIRTLKIGDLYCPNCAFKRPEQVLDMNEVYQCHKCGTPWGWK